MCQIHKQPSYFTRLLRSHSSTTTLSCPVHSFQSSHGHYQLQQFWNCYRNLYDDYQSLKANQAYLQNKIKNMQINEYSYNNSCRYKENSCFFQNNSLNSRSLFRNRRTLLDMSNGSKFDSSYRQGNQDISWKLQKTQQIHHSEQIQILKNQIDNLNLELKKKNEQLSKIQSYIIEQNNQLEKNHQIIENTLQKYRDAKKLQSQFREKYNKLCSQNRLIIQQKNQMSCQFERRQIQNKKYVSTISQLREQLFQLNKNYQKSIENSRFTSHQHCHHGCHHQCYHH